ncbi:MAG: single-stranded DNA-binding protein [Solirubrobacteraceae bacterium]
MQRPTASSDTPTRRHADATLRVAVQRSKRNGEDQRADFFDVTTFGAQAENVAQYLATGRLVAISGRLRHHTWEHDGQRHQKVDIVTGAYGITFLGGPRSRDDSEEDFAVPQMDDDDVTAPF